MRKLLVRSLPGLALALAIAAPAAAVPPTISPVPLEPSYTWYCGDAEIISYVTFTMVTELDFYDQDGNLTRQLMRGPITYRLVAANGNSMTLNSNAMFIYDARTDQWSYNGYQLWFNGTVTLGRFGSVGAFGTVKDICAELGYPA